MADRRRFLASMLALATAPAIVRASSLMKLASPFEELESGLIMPQRFGLLTPGVILQEALRVFEVTHVLAREANQVITDVDSFPRGEIAIRIGDIFTIEGVK